MQPASAVTSRYYRPELDVLRFLAFLLVFLHHTLPSGNDPRVVHLLKGWLPAFVALTDACAYGLSLFFTLSAFLICELLLREREKTGEISVKQFYIRRILRIWPLYYLGVLLGVLVAVLPGGHHSDLGGIAWFAFFGGSWYITTYGGLAQPVNALWSISVEEQFYLFAPWIAKYFNRGALYGFCAAVFAFSNVCLYLLGQSSAVDRVIWFNSLVQFECFAAGILICLILHGRLPNIAAWQRVALIVLCLSCWFYACYGLGSRFGNHGQQNPGSWHLIAGYALAMLGCVLVLVAVLGVTPRLLPRWAIYLGRISFGLYVYHGFAIYLTDHLIVQYVATLKNPIINSLKGPIFLLNICLTLGITILIAALSYRYFETPFLKMKKRHSVIESQPIAGDS
jgi:peptidoglycan/LPS O-acetylase OafA/YrhL